MNTTILGITNACQMRITIVAKSLPPGYNIVRDELLSHLHPYIGSMPAPDYNNFSSLRFSTIKILPSRYDKQ